MNKIFPIRDNLGGVISDIPSPKSPPGSFDDVLNFFVRKGTIQSRPKIDIFGTQDNTTPRTFVSFRDLLGNYHTIKLVNYTAGSTPAYALDNTGVWNALGFPVLGAGQTGSSLPYAIALIQNQCYFANGGYPLWYADGSASVKTANSPGTCRFLAVNVNHLLQAYTTEPAPSIGGSTVFPKRVRWSGVNNPQSWDPGADFTAGFNDLLDVPDFITGLSTNGRNSYVWRENGVTVAFPTGVALSAFEFENYSVAPEGVGNIFPYALDTWNNMTPFISNDDLYMFDSTNFNNIGAGNTQKIFNDLAANSGDVVWGKIIPGFPGGYDFLSYWLTIPGPNVTWVYSFKDNLWVREQFSQGYLTALRSVVTQ